MFNLSYQKTVPETGSLSDLFTNWSVSSFRDLAFYEEAIFRFPSYMITSVSCLIFPWKMSKLGQIYFTHFLDCLFLCHRIFLAYWNLKYLRRHVAIAG